MNKNIKIELSSNLEYEGMVVYIVAFHREIALINYDKGIDNIEIEILFNEKESDNINLSLEDFIDVLEKAKELAIKCAKEDELRTDFNITE